MSTVDKALKILDLFEASRPEIGLTDFKNLTGYDKGTVHRYLTSLRDCGFLEQNTVTKAYRLGPAIIRLAQVRENTNPLRNIATRIVKSAALNLGELVHASLPQSDGMSTLCCYDGGTSGTRVGLNEADVLPFHATSSGLVMLAFGPSALLKTVTTGTNTKFTDATLTAPSEVQSAVENVLENGYATASSTYEDDVSSVAAPFFKDGPFAYGTLAVAVPSSRMTPAHQAKIIELLFAETFALTQEIGGKVPASYLQTISRRAA